MSSEILFYYESRQNPNGDPGFENQPRLMPDDTIMVTDVRIKRTIRDYARDVKGETLFDTIQMVDGYTDIIAMRHPRQGAARYAQDAARVPILNGGDGAGHHPTQTMLDLFTILQSHDTLEGLSVVLAGDLRYGRTVHSLSHALVRFGCKLILASPELLRMPTEIIEDLREHGADVTETEEEVDEL